MLRRLLPVVQCQLQATAQVLQHWYDNPWLDACCSGQPVRRAHTVRMVLLQASVDGVVLLGAWDAPHDTCCCAMQDHPHLGERGQIVHVKPGYARQTLFPQQVADYALPEVLRQLQVRRCGAAPPAAGVWQLCPS